MSTEYLWKISKFLVSRDTNRGVIGSKENTSSEEYILSRCERIIYNFLFYFFFFRRVTAFSYSDTRWKTRGISIFIERLVGSPAQFESCRVVVYSTLQVLRLQIKFIRNGWTIASIESFIGREGVSISISKLTLLSNNRCSKFYTHKACLRSNEKCFPVLISIVRDTAFKISITIVAIGEIASKTGRIRSGTKLLEFYR